MTGRITARQIARTGKTPLPQRVALAYPGTTGRVILPSDPALLDGLSACLSGWQPRVTPLRAAPAAPLAAVAAMGRGRYDMQSRFIDRPSTDLSLASTVCALVADLSQDWAETQRGVIGLHGGAVAVDGRLLLLTGPARAGKSTLVTRLAAAPGVTFFCDDVLPVTASGAGVALGIAPRLRLPLPHGSGALATLAQTAMILSDDRYGYLRLPDQAAHGTQAPLGAILLLDRRPDAPARLQALDPAEALSTLLRQSITGFASAGAAFARARALTAARPCLRLVYSDLEDATALILRAFGPGATLPEILPPIAPLPPAAPTLAPAAADVVFHRNPQLRIRRHGAAAYLWQAGEPMLWELNPVAHAIWQMLELPGSADDLVAALADHFPQISRTALMQDTTLLLAQLRAEGLVAPAATG